MHQDILYGAGSDDFRGYVWKIPDLSTLLGLRQAISADEWMSHEWTGVCGELIKSSNVISLHSSCQLTPKVNGQHDTFPSR